MSGVLSKWLGYQAIRCVRARRRRADQDQCRPRQRAPRLIAAHPTTMGSITLLPAGAAECAVAGRCLASHVVSTGTPSSCTNLTPPFLRALRKNYEIIALMIPVGTACTFAVYKMYDKMSSDQDLRIRADRGELNDWESERIDPSKAEQVCCLVSDAFWSEPNILRRPSLGQEGRCLEDARRVNLLRPGPASACLDPSPCFRHRC